MLKCVLLRGGSIPVSLDQRFAFGRKQACEGDFEGRFPLQLAFLVQIYEAVAVLIPQFRILK